MNWKPNKEGRTPNCILGDPHCHLCGCDCPEAAPIGWKVAVAAIIVVVIWFFYTHPRGWDL